MKLSATLVSVALAAAAVNAETPASMAPDGRWGVKVAVDGKSATFQVDPPGRMEVKGERHSRLPPKDKKRTWNKECQLLAIRVNGCTVAYAVIPESVSIKTAAGRVLTRGRDYEVDAQWGAPERVEGGSVQKDEPILIDYSYLMRRIDSVVRGADGTLSLRKGKPHVVTPVPPELAPGETRLGNVLVDAETSGVSERNLYPVLDPVPPTPTPRGTAPRLLPKTWAKLNRGETVTILAWGDSVTACGFLPNKDKWQEQFVRRLRARFPKADIRLVSNGWGGRCSHSFCSVPETSPYNFDRKVAGVKADLVISEFVNDCGGGERVVRDWYPKFLEAFRKAGSEWVILTPHYVRPSWMGLKECRNSDDDPRPFVKAVRKFASDNGVALADASRRWGHLWREGIPFSTMYVNDINHPVALGMEFFADSLMALFDESK